VLLIEDNEADVFLVREAIRAANLQIDLQVLGDGEKAIRYIEEMDRNPPRFCPELVLLDINLPKISGAEVLQRLRTSKSCASASVLVVTSSDSAHDRQLMAELGASAYFRKPSNYEDFMKLGEIIHNLITKS
jgi:DNA-binding response OmpR family regulator